MTPHVPLTVNEIIEDVHEAWEIGITMVHLHARDEQQEEPTYPGGGLRPDDRRHPVGSQNDLIICVSLSGGRSRIRKASGAAEPGWAI